MREAIMKNRQHGMTVIEAMGAIAIGSMMLIGLTSMVDTSMADLKGQQAAQYQAQVVEAARAYIKANYTALKDAAYQPDIVVQVPLDTLRAGNYLRTSFASKNIYDQETCLLVRQPVAGSGKLDALVVTTGGQRIADKDIAYAASQAGQGNGYISNALPTTAQGASWRLATDSYRGVACYNGGAAALTGTAADGGHLVSTLFHDGPGQVATDFLHRYEVPGQPELNKMHTSIRFTGDALKNSGDDCGSHAAITFNSNREMLRCDTDGKWRHVTTWKKPVLNYAELSATPGDTGDVRMIRDKDLAFTYDGNTGKWVPLAVDQNGDLYVSRHIYAGSDVNAGNDVNAGSDMYAARDITAGNQVNGNTIHSDWWVESTHFEPTQRRWPRDPCMVPSAGGYRWTLGSIVRDGNGMIMSCQYIGGQYVFAYPNGSFYP